MTKASTNSTEKRSWHRVGAYVTSKDVTVHLAQDRPTDTEHKIAVSDGTTRLASDVAREARDAWDTILRAHGLF